VRTWHKNVYAVSYILQGFRVPSIQDETKQHVLLPFKILKLFQDVNIKKLGRLWDIQDGIPNESQN
jgi:hypothetical protein